MQRHHLTALGPPIESVAGILFSEDRQSILLIQRRDVPVWVLPGGGIEPLESSESAIEREFFEETGLQVVAHRLVGAYLPINRLAKATHLYECTLVSGTLCVSEETRRVQFFSLTTLPKEIPPPYLQWIQDTQQHMPPTTKYLIDITYKKLFIYLLSHPVLVFRFFLARLGIPYNSK